MKITIIQSPIVWENPTVNRNYFKQKIDAIPENVDLIVLPEMFTTGFTMNPNHIAESMEGETVLWLKLLAKAKDSAITGSIIIEEDNKFYNRLLFVFPSGEIQFYDKRHLFSLAGEDEIYTKGTQKLIVEFKGFRICPLICYDLRFPVFARNTQAYNLLIFVANWPSVRINAWDTLLKARAIENMAYVIGVNRIGEDDNHHKYTGHSQVVDYMGNYLITPKEAEGIFITTLNKGEMFEARQKLGFLNDKDTFEIFNLS